MVLGHVRSDFDALAQPHNRPLEIVRPQALLGLGEAFVQRFLGFGFSLAQREGSSLRKLLVVPGAFLVIHKSLVSLRQPPSGPATIPPIRSVPYGGPGGIYGPGDGSSV